MRALVLLTLLGCGRYTLQEAKAPPPPVRDDKLSISGSLCADEPEPLEFPLKVMFISDVSQSMNVTDPTPVTCATPPCLPRRSSGILQVLNTYPGGNGVEYALMSFASDSNVLTYNAKMEPGFTPDSNTVKSLLPSLSSTMGETGYETALASAFARLQSDMLSLDATARSRARYVVVFMSDGLPAPVTPDSNTPERIRQRVLDIKALERDQRLAEVQLHTVYLAGPDTPDAVRLFATNLLEDMARTGGGTFRSFASGEPISFFYIDFRAFIRAFSMKSLLVANRSEKAIEGEVQPDSDGDGLCDIDEVDPGTDPTNPDSDGDGFSDGLEVRLSGSGFDPNFSGDADCGFATDKLDDDGDGLRNCEERFLGSNPRLMDSDADGVSDEVEYRAASNAAASDVLTDADFDGVRTGVELAAHTDPSVDDSNQLSQIGYRYTISETPSQGSKRCYEFEVGNITLAPTLAANGFADGTNVVWLTALTAPQDSPDDFGNAQIACVLPRFTLTPDRKVPATGKLTLPPDAFKKPEDFNAERDCVRP